MPGIREQRSNSPTNLEHWQDSFVVLRKDATMRCDAFACTTGMLTLAVFGYSFLDKPSTNPMKVIAFVITT